MEHFFSLTFAIQDEANHAIAQKNHQGAQEWYKKRVEFMLDAVREALNEVG